MPTFWLPIHWHTTHTHRYSRQTHKQNEQKQTTTTKELDSNWVLSCHVQYLHDIWFYIYLFKLGTDRWLSNCYCTHGFFVPQYQIIIRLTTSSCATVYICRNELVLTRAFRISCAKFVAPAESKYVAAAAVFVLFLYSFVFSLFTICSYFYFSTGNSCKHSTGKPLVFDVLEIW